MKHFTVVYSMPVEGLAEWMKKPETERKAAEAELKGEWDAWLAAHAGSVLNTVGLGKNKRVSTEGVADAPNGLMLSSYVAAESLEEAAALFKDHPHLKIPGATIDVMEANPLTGM